MRWRVLLVLVPVMVLAALSDGCSAHPSTLSGDVTMDGKPLDDGLITFLPSDGATAPIAVKIKDGKYTASAPAGSYKVQISAPKPTGEKKQAYPTPNSPVFDVIAETIPERYNAKTELKADVTAGDKKFDWPLTSK